MKDLSWNKLGSDELTDIIYDSSVKNGEEDLI